MSYKATVVVQDPRLLDVKAHATQICRLVWHVLCFLRLQISFTIPAEGNLTVDFSPAFSSYFNCKDVGSTNVQLTLTFWPPPAQMPFINFVKECASPCSPFDNCWSHGVIK